jgi:hypothetical protein
MDLSTYEEMAKWPTYSKLCEFSHGVLVLKDIEDNKLMIIFSDSGIVRERLFTLKRGSFHRRVNEGPALEHFDKNGKSEYRSYYENGVLAKPPQPDPNAAGPSGREEA